MARPQLSPLQRQIARVSRRLFLQTMLGCLLWCWAAALATTAAWFVAQPFLAVTVGDAWRLPIAGGLVGLATLVAMVLAVLKAPPRLAAALLLDEKFGLKERVTTSLTLAPEMAASPAAQALLADVNERIDQLDVGSRFPVRVSWLTTLAPACAVVLAVAAFYYQPPSSQANIGPKDPGAEAPKNAAEIEQKIAQLKKKPAEKARADREMSEELRRIEAELDQIANRPRQTKEQLRERVKEMTALEDYLKNRERELTDRSRSLKTQLHQMDQMANHNGNQEGPLKELRKALSEGKLEKAHEEIQKLSKKLKDNRLTNEEKKQLAKQLKDLQNQLERAADQTDKKDQLKKLNQEGKLDAEALKREMKQLEEESQKLKDLQKLANQFGQCRLALEQGKSSQAVQSLEDAADQLNDIDLQDGDLADLREQLQRLRDAKDSC
jgi:uncharacterized coiled-coil DUF342 family protein